MGIYKRCLVIWVLVVILLIQLNGCVEVLGLVDFDYIEVVGKCWLEWQKWGLVLYDVLYGIIDGGDVVGMNKCYGFD